MSSCSISGTANSADGMLPGHAGMKLSVPQHLIDEMKAGRVIAFLGAGFSAAANMPTWKELIMRIANRAFAESRLTSSQFQFVERLVMSRGSGSDLDQAMQFLEDLLSIKYIADTLLEIMKPPEPLPDEMYRRLCLLKSLPFRAILTTNFDELLPGVVSSDLGARPVEQILRQPTVTSTEDPFAWDLRVFDRNQSGKDVPAVAPILQLHGRISNANSLVCTRQAYRKLLNLVPGYATFLRSLMSVYTVLYMGFSFSDQYLNQLRSEVLSVLRPLNTSGLPLAYAIVMDKSEEDAEFFRVHEGVHFLPWNTKGNTDFSGNERYMWIIRNRTNPWVSLGAMLHRRRFLCIDPFYDTANGLGDLVPSMHLAVYLYEKEEDDEIWQSPTSRILELNRERMAVRSVGTLSPPMKRQIAPFADSPPRTDEASVTVFDGEAFERRIETPSLVVHRCLTIDGFLRALNNKSQPAYDVIICNYGFREGKRPFVFDLLKALHKSVDPSKRAPVIVYSHPQDTELRKEEVLRYGASAYAKSVTGLFDALNHLFKPSQ
eukprot:ANDGO_06778.mRNA.1 hypothetical protein